MQAVQLGDKVIDQISGFTGTVISKVEYLNGCVQFCVLPKCDKDGKYVEGIYFDSQRLQVIEESGHAHEGARTGGGDSFAETGRDTMGAPRRTYRG